MFHHHRLIEKLDAIAVCDIETGQTNVIVDIDESRWGAAPGGEDDWQQQTTRPRLLPIVGDVDTQMSLQILSTSSSSSSSQQQQQFTLVGKELRLSSPLDRDERDISSVIVQVSCTDRQTLKRRNIPVVSPFLFSSSSIFHFYRLCC